MLSCMCLGSASESGRGPRGPDDPKALPALRPFCHSTAHAGSPLPAGSAALALHRLNGRTSGMQTTQVLVLCPMRTSMVRGKEPGCQGSAARGTEAGRTGGLAGQPTSITACPVSPVPVPGADADADAPTGDRHLPADGVQIRYGRMQRWHLQVATPDRIACDTQRLAKHPGPARYRGTLLVSSNCTCSRRLRRYLGCWVETYLPSGLSHLPR